MNRNDPSRTTLDRVVPWLLSIITVVVLAAALHGTVAHLVHSLQVASSTLAPAAAQALGNLLGGL